MASARLAVDIGGTFTDLAIEHQGQRTTIKVLTTPAAPEQGVMAGVQAILAASGLKAADITILVHGTTLVTNMLVEGRFARVALLTTSGFEDVLHIARASRDRLYRLDLPPRPASVVTPG